MKIHPYDFIFVGLIFDIAGTLILAKGFMFKRARAAYLENLALYGGNFHALKSTLIQRAEAQVGAVGDYIFGNDTMTIVEVSVGGKK